MTRYLALLGGASLVALAFPSALERTREPTPPEPPVDPAPAVIDIAAPPDGADQPSSRSITAGPGSPGAPRR